jgi:hypothetical protein
VRADALLTKFLLTERSQRLLIATLNDLAAVYAKNAIEMNRRQSDCIIVSQGLDRHINGSISEKKSSIPITVAGWCLDQLPTTWTAMVTRSCRLPYACLPATPCPHAH